MGNTCDTMRKDHAVHTDMGFFPNTPVLGVAALLAMFKRSSPVPRRPAMRLNLDRMCLRDQWVDTQQHVRGVPKKGN